MNKEHLKESLNDEKYLGVPYEKLRFVRVVGGLNDCNVDEQGNLHLKLPDDKTSIGMRNTTHGTLNGIVSDHLMGTFSSSKYAVVAPLVEMAKHNELISLSPSDSYFWNANKGVSIPNAVLFAPHEDTLPFELGDELSVIRYKPDNNPQNNYENMAAAIGTYFEENNLPLYGVDNRSWRGRSLNEPTMDSSGVDTQKFANHIGYPITWGLHDGTAYSELENIHTNILRTAKEFSSIDSAMEFNEANQQRMNQDQLPSFGEAYDKSISQYNALRGELPEHHRDYYDLNVLPEITKFKVLLDQKIDVWFPAEPAISQEKISIPPPLPSTPPPLPSNPPPLPSNPNNENLNLLKAAKEFNKPSNPILNDLSELCEKQKELVKNDIERLRINPVILNLGTTKNAYTDYMNLNTENQALFGHGFEEMTRDPMASVHLKEYAEISEKLANATLQRVHLVSEKVGHLAPKRDFSGTPEQLREWRTEKDTLLNKIQVDSNFARDLKINSAMIDVCLNHIETSPKKNWFASIVSRTNPLNNLDLGPVEAITTKLDNENTQTSKNLLNAINAPTEEMVRAEKLRLFLNSLPTTETLEYSSPTTGTEHEKEQPKPELVSPCVNIQNDLKAAPVKESKKVLYPKEYLNDYLHNVKNDQNTHLLNEKFVLEGARNKLGRAFDQMVIVLQENGLSGGDLIFSEKNGMKYPEASYDAKIIFSQSPEARMALSHAANTLENYGSLCIAHQEHLQEGLSKVKDNNPMEQINSIEHIELSRELSSHLDHLAEPLKQYASLYENFDEKHDNQMIKERVAELNVGIIRDLSSEAAKTPVSPSPEQIKKNDFNLTL